MLEPGVNVPVVVKRGPDVPVSVIVEAELPASRAPPELRVRIPLERFQSDPEGRVSSTDAPVPVPCRVVVFPLEMVRVPAMLTVSVLVVDDALGLTVKSPLNVVVPDANV